MENLIITWALPNMHLHFTDVILALLFFFIFICITQRLATNGPMIWPFIGIIPSLLLHFNELYDWSTMVLSTCGGSFYYKGLWLKGGFKGFITTDPMKVEYMLKTKFHNFPKGEYFRERFHDMLGNAIFNADGDEWKDQRMIVKSEMYTYGFMGYSLKTMQNLVHNKLLKVISNSNKVDLQDLLLRFTLDNICLAAVGVDLGSLALDLPRLPYAKAIEEALQYSLFRFIVPPFMWKPMRYLNLGKEKKLKEAVEIVHEFTKTAIKNRKADLLKPKYEENHHQSQECHDLLSRLLMKMQSGMYFSDKFLSDFCTSFILAGRDTSSVALVWFFWLINQNPDVEHKIMHELVEISSENHHSEIIFSAEELDKMVYLQAAITESLRLYPPVPMDFKEAKEDEVYPDGMRIPKGARVFYHIYAMGRMETIWGKDCMEFKPERWIKDGQFVSENQYKFTVFNAGPRICVGKKFAYLQMKMIAASILLRYKVKVVKDQVIVPKITTTLYMKHGLLVTFEPR